VPSEDLSHFIFGEATFGQIGLGALQLPEILCQGLDKHQALVNNQALVVLYPFSVGQQA
jgi:hypothetical protein